MKCSLLLAVGLMCPLSCVAADFATKGGAQPTNVDQIVEVLKQDSHDLELLITSGTSQRGSAGHLALAVRERGQATTRCIRPTSTPTVSRSPRGSLPRGADNRVPKKEYCSGRPLAGPHRLVGARARRAYRRSVVGVRVYGVPAGGARAAVYFARINADYRWLAPGTPSTTTTRSATTTCA